ncbi:MAG TPA: hypothetical protein VKH81_06190 [Candidatus Angelobacter sp.]|nr:hypothetical protein [Candidatus Angelobacter sp.]
MAKKAAKKSARRKTAPSKKKNKALSPQQQQQPISDAATEAASQRFVGDLLVRGEAAPRDNQGNVPLHATHVITGKKPDGTPTVKRIRFKAF